MVSHIRCLPVVELGVLSWMVFVVASILIVVPMGCDTVLCRRGYQSTVVRLCM